MRLKLENKFLSAKSAFQNILTLSELFTETVRHYPNLLSVDENTENQITSSKNYPTSERMQCKNMTTVL